MLRLVPVLVIGLLLSGCSADDAPDPDPAPISVAPMPPTPHQIVQDPDAVLMEIRVAGRDNRSVTSAWQLGRRRAIVHTEDAFETARYLRWTQHRAEKWLPSGRRFGRPHLVGLDGLLTWAAPEIGHLGVAVLGGGDGATLFPFEKVSRFDGRRWTAYDVPKVRGQRAYTGGGVVLPDGRLLVLLDHWSGDRRGRPSATWHGLWASEGDDWTSYRPWRPPFSPRPVQPRFGSAVASLAGSSGRDGVMWVTTWDGHAYVSEDGTAFREIRSR